MAIHRVRGSEDRLGRTRNEAGQTPAACHGEESLERALLEQIPTATYITTIDQTWRRLYISPEIESMLGFSSADWFSDLELWAKQIHPEDRERVLAEVSEGHDNGNPFRSEYRMLTKEGRVVWVRDESFLVKEESGQPSLIQGVLWDISEYRLGRERLEKNDTKFLTIFERVAVGIALVDMEGRLIKSNPALQAMLGYREEELRNRIFIEFTHPGDATADTGLYQEVVEGKRDHYQMEKRYIRKDGAVIWGRVTVSLVRGQQGERPFTIRMVEDITEQKRLESNFLQVQKMETVGQLAGGIAHDFSNLLTVIKGYSQLSLSELKEGDPLKRNMEEVQRATERAMDLTRQLLAFSRRQVMDMKVLDLNAIITDLSRMLRCIIGEDIELITVLAEDLGRVKTDPGQIEQVILNLVVNARDAMPNGGTLTIETSNVELDEDYARTHIQVTPNRYIRLSVSDTGCGMTPEVMERIFEPLFTTKGKGKGTGLGLSTVYGIVKQSGGHIWAYSEPGQGSAFKIYLPKVEEEIDRVSQRKETGHVSRGNETVLLVEDDLSVRGLASRILREYGYTILEATDGGEAMRLGHDHLNEKIHLLLTDVVMPQMGGKELLKQFKALHPEIKVLFMSGYTDHAITHHPGFNPGEPFLGKPFSPTALARKVREVLDR
jgi:PAS domain S-box-containing protein